jgi:hypothetical protein
VKRRQRVLKLCIWPRNHVNAGAFVLLGAGAASRGPLWLGLLGPAGVLECGRGTGWIAWEPEKSCAVRAEKPEWGTPASKCPWPEKTASGLTGARKRYTNRVRDAWKLEAKP